jgi:hypothetical protein
VFVTIVLILGFWSVLEGYLTQHQPMATILGAVITVLGAALIANRYAKRVKRVDATLEFSKRYRDLIAEGAKLNDTYVKKSSPTAIDQEPGREWWVRFFDLMQFEYRFYRHGLILPEMFAQWMWWRHFDYTGERSHQKLVAGIDYPTGWKHYQSLPALKDDPYIQFMELVHAASSRRMLRKVLRWHRVLMACPL